MPCRPKWTIYKHVADEFTKYLSVGKSGILSVVVVIVCVLASAYSSVCRGFEYLLKVRYIVLVDPLWDGFLISETVFLGRSATLPYVWKKYHIYERRLHILIYWHVRCDCKLWNTLWFHCVFWIFSYTLLLTSQCWIVVSPPNFHWISHQYWYVKMSNFTVIYGMPPNFIKYLSNFSQNWLIFMSEVMHEGCLSKQM